MRRATGKPVKYTATVTVPFYEAREVTFFLLPDEREPKVLVDGPSSSPHRYPDGSLCMWHPSDPAAHRWRPEDGLLDLLDATVDHLFREAWWREHDEWLGPEAPHEPSAERKAR